MARYHVRVRVRTGWPASAGDLYATRYAARRLPRPMRLLSTLCYVEGDVEFTLRTRCQTPAMAIQQVRLALPMLRLRRETVRRIDVLRIHPLPSYRFVLASWTPLPDRSRIEKRRSAGGV
ncbi:hypothetical protein [Streptomyces sp. SID13031]|uniref:hypothetical protein n=1 Tax=Streptomyces sp. SID13031 TaxID=2706046 RepID=UPI0013CBD7A5|nr:hypothetical protein [Streptomyces sp. SID13031]NEA30538.1 hypothetical protein [Streptomyces sp. SID13031]